MRVWRRRGFTGDAPQGVGGAGSSSKGYDDDEVADIEDAGSVVVAATAAIRVDAAATAAAAAAGTGGGGADTDIGVVLNDRLERYV